MVFIAATVRVRLSCPPVAVAVAATTTPTPDAAVEIKKAMTLRLPSSSKREHRAMSKLIQIVRNHKSEGGDTLIENWYEHVVNVQCHTVS